MSTEGVRERMEAAVDEAREQAARSTRRARRLASDLARDTLYAYVGAVDAGVEEVGRLARRAAALPQETVRTTLGVPGRVRDGFTALAHRGRAVVRRMERRASSIDAVAERAAEVTNGASEYPARPYEERTVDELYSLAVERNLQGRSSMSKDELIAALRG